MAWTKTAFARTASAALAGAAVVAAMGTAVVMAADDDEDDDDDAAASAEQQKVAQEALTKAIARGKELWNDPKMGKKTCAKCHDDPEKPKINLTTRPWSYPAYSRRKRNVVTLQQKIQEMIQFNTRGQPLDDKGADIAALEAYVVSLKKK
jgi:cytochrome c